MEIQRIGSQPSGKGPAEWFTGAVRINSRFQRSNPARIGGAIVTFEPGARTAWHTHPLGQTLIVTSGRGWVQREGGPVEEIRPGDVVWFAPAEKHWHGATATTAMTHIAIAEVPRWQGGGLDGARQPRAIPTRLTPAGAAGLTPPPRRNRKSRQLDQRLCRGVRMNPRRGELSSDINASGHSSAW